MVLIRGLHGSRPLDAQYAISTCSCPYAAKHSGTCLGPLWLCPCVLTYMCCACRRCAVLCCVVQVYGLRPFRIPLRWDFQNKTDAAEQVYSGVT